MANVGKGRNGAGKNPNVSRKEKTARYLAMTVT